MTSITRTAPVATCLFIAGFAAAQTDDRSLDPVDQVIVTGARTPVPSNRVGSAVSVISRSDIERRQARYVSDLLRTVPGIAVSQTGVIGSQTQVRIRGAEANHVLVLIDGVRANDPATGDEFRWEYLGTGNIERIEIVRGPQSALWGSEAVGAVIHIITRTESGTNRLGAYAESGANSTLNIGANGVTQLRHWTLRGGVEAFETDGGNISRSGGERDGADLVTGSMAARYASPGGLELTAGIRMLDAVSETDPVDFFVTGLPVDGNRETHSENLAGDIRGSFAAHGGRVTYHVNAGYYDSAHRNFVDGTEATSTASDRLAIALQSDITLSDNVLSLALEHETTDYRQRGEIVFGDPNQDQTMRVSSLIAEYQHLANDRMTWIFSGRYDRHSDFDDALTGKASLAFHVSEDTLVRASLGTAHKTPTFIERFGFFPDQFIGNPNLKPETSTSYDLGIDRRFINGDLVLQASVYAQELDDEINGFVFDPVTFLGTAENRRGTSNRSGFELSANWRIAPAIGIAASYTYADASEEATPGEVETELRRPRHSGSVSFDVASAGDRLSLSLIADYGGSRKDRFFPPFPEPPRVVTLDDFWVVDATLQFRLTPAIAVFVRGTNLLDENYEQVYGFRTLGRAAYVGIRAAFEQR